MDDQNLNQNFSEEPELLVFTDDDGNDVTVQVLDYLNYNGEEYAVLAEQNEAQEALNKADEADAAQLEIFFMKVVPVEDSEDEVEFQPIEEEGIEDELFAIINSDLDEEDTEE